MLNKKVIYLFTIKSYQKMLEEIERFNILFDDFIQNPIYEEYVIKNEKKLDEMGHVTISPKMDELEFGYYVNADQINHLKSQFGLMKTTIVIENLPYLENNPFQVSWLKLFVNELDQCLVDLGGMEYLESKSDFLNRISCYRDLETFAVVAPKKQMRPEIIIPYEKTPLDFIIDKLKLEITKTNTNAFLETLENNEMKKLFHIYLTENKINALYPIKNKMDPKKFGDQTESLYFKLIRFNSDKKS